MYSESGRKENSKMNSFMEEFKKYKDTGWIKEEKHISMQVTRKEVFENSITWIILTVCVVSFWYGIWNFIIWLLGAL